MDASEFDLSGLTSLRLGSIGAQLGESINEFSADGLLSGNSNTAVPTEQAVKTYVDTEIQSLVDNELAALTTQINNLDVSDAFLSLAYDDANTTYDADGWITGATTGTITYSNIVYEDLGRDPVGDIEFAKTKRITSYTETNSASSTTNNVTITYNSDGSVNDIVVTEV